jgi:response regulator NasT
MNMATPNHTLRIAVADDDPEVRTYFQELLPRLGHQVVVADNGRHLVDQCRVLEPDLVIADIKLPDMDGIEAAQAINRHRETPIILVSGHHNAELLERAATGPIMAYLTKPVKQADVETAIRLARVRFEQFHALRQEAADLRQALEDRKLIERAKGIVGRRLGLDEQEAFTRLRKLASNRNWKLVEVSQAVLRAEEMFHLLEKV